MNINGYSVISTDLISAYAINGGGFLWSADEIQKLSIWQKIKNFFK